MKTKEQIKDEIIEKKDELISSLNIMLITPEPTTFKAEGDYMSLLLKNDRIIKELDELKQQLSQLNSPINKPDFFDSKIDYCAKCAAKMKAINETRYVCMNPECDDYLKTE